MAKKKEMGQACSTGCGCCTPKCKGMKMLILGILVLLNSYYYIMTWPNFIGAMLLIWGIVKIAMPRCQCH